MCTLLYQELSELKYFFLKNWVFWNTRIWIIGCNMVCRKFPASVFGVFFFFFSQHKICVILVVAIFLIDVFILFWASTLSKHNLRRLKHHTAIRSNWNKESQTTAIIIKLKLLMETHKKLFRYTSMLINTRNFLKQYQKYLWECDPRAWESVIHRVSFLLQECCNKKQIKKHSFRVWHHRERRQEVQDSSALCSGKMDPFL